MEKIIRSIGKSVIFASAVVLTCLQADTPFPDTRILGLEVGTAKVQGDTLLEKDHVGSDMELGVRIGTQSDEWRALLTGSWFDSSDDDQQYFKALVGFDYFVLDAQGLRPYIGLNIGYLSYQTTAIDTDSMLYGGEVGFQYKFGEHAAIDLTYRYSFAGADEVDHVEAFVIGIDYLY